MHIRTTLCFCVLSVLIWYQSVTILVGTVILRVGATLFLCILWGVALFKDPTLPYTTALMHYVARQASIYLGGYYIWRQKWNLSYVKSVQDDVLHSILRLNGATEYGTKYQLYSISSRDEFVKRHPITKPDHYAEYVQRMMDGERGILAADKVIYFAVTSGTTGEPSVIPLTRRSIVTQFPVVNMVDWMTAWIMPITLRFRRRMRLFYNPSRLMIPTLSGAFMGPLSSYTQQSFFSRMDVFTTPSVGFDITDNASAEYVHILFGLRYRDLACVDGMFASVVYFAFQTLEQNWREMVRDLRYGTLNPTLKIPHATRVGLEKRLTAMPGRANELKREFDKGFDDIAIRIWPKLRLINAIASGAFQQYATILRDKYTKGVKIFTPYYTATEGTFGYNHWPENEDVRFLLASKTLFYEFLPVEHADDSNPITLFADQVERGKEYEIIVTSYAGMYRYRVGDVVRVVDLYGQYPVMQYVHRSTQMLSIRGEKTSETALQHAITYLNILFSGRHDFSRIKDYSSCESTLFLSKSVQPGKNGIKHVPFYVVFVELQGLVEADMVEEVRFFRRENKRLEAELGLELETYLTQSENDESGYKYQRERGNLAAAKVLLVPPGAFQQLREFMINNSTTSPAQLKIPRVLTKPELVEFLCSVGVI